MQQNTSRFNLIGLGKNTSLLALIHQYYIIGDLILLGYSFEILKQALFMIFKMTAPINFELSPQGTLNSLKFAHEHLYNQFFYGSGGNIKS